MENPNGYYRNPTVFDQNVVFVSEDDLWMVPLTGGTAIRLTSGLGACSGPAFSPDGRWIAFSSAEEGYREVFLVPAGGGPLQRLTYLGGIATVAGWASNTEVLFRTEGFDAHRVGTLAVVSIAGGEPRSLHLGPATTMTEHPLTGAIVLERNSWRAEPAHWKRYRGGTAGKFFFASQLDGEFRSFLSHLNGNLSRPLWIGDRLFFLSDHEGIGNIYSCEATGGGMKKHTEFRTFYVRNPATDGRTLVFHAGADLYRLDPLGGEARKIEVKIPSQRTQRQRKFVPASDSLEQWSFSDDGRSLCFTSRGQVASMEAWAGPVAFAGRQAGVRYRLGCWFDNDSKIVFVGDESGEEQLCVHDLKTRETKTYANLDLGRVTHLKPSPVGERHVALANHRNELIVVDLVVNAMTVVTRNEHQIMRDFNWSPDGRYIAYGKTIRPHSSCIEIHDLEARRSHRVTRPLLWDGLPTFDPEGKYLYFSTGRELNPTYDEIQFDLSFHKTSLLCLVTLRKDVPSPLIVPPRAEEASSSGVTPAATPGTSGASSASDNSSNSKVKTPPPIQIDFDGIEDRMVRLPAPSARIVQTQAAKNRIYFMTWPVEGALGGDWFSTAPQAKGETQFIDLTTGKVESFQSGVSGFELSRDGSRMAIQQGRAIRIVRTESRPEESRPNEEFSSKKGWVDLDRMKVLIEPAAEWRQMLREVWRLQRDHFWREDMSKIQWRKTFETYAPLVDRVACRSEFGDLVWELQGELGTSHAYDIGGDYRAEPKYFVGFLGATFEWDATARGYTIKELWKGDPWKNAEAGPLTAPGIGLVEGDVIVEVQGCALSERFTPREVLMNLAGQVVEIGVRRKGRSTSDEIERLRVKTLRSEAGARYRTWVEVNRKYVHEKSGGKVGYVHIPDMSAHGFAEFHRSFLQEFDRDGLVIDVRYNGGGHVSSLLLEKLARRRIGFDETRWMGRSPFPGESPAGPLVALTNEYAGSDGDIFSHSFKLMKLGPLLGTRTWGGVIGIWPRHRLVDGGITTQPEFSFWFSDVGWNVENYGTDPDLPIDNLPHHYRRKEDPQLDLAINEALTLIESKPPFRPVVTEYPNLAFTP